MSIKCSFLILAVDRAFDGLFLKIKGFIFKTEYEPLTSLEYSIFDGAIKFYKKSIEESKVDLAARMVPQVVIDAYVESQKETVQLAEKIINKILKSV